MRLIENKLLLPFSIAKHKMMEVRLTSTVLIGFRYNVTGDQTRNRPRNFQSGPSTPIEEGCSRYKYPHSKEVCSVFRIQSYFPSLRHHSVLRYSTLIAFITSPFFISLSLMTAAFLHPSGIRKTSKYFLVGSPVSNKPPKRIV